MKLRIINSQSRDFRGHGQFIVRLVPEQHYMSEKSVAHIGYGGYYNLKFSEAYEAISLLLDGTDGSTLANECPVCQGHKTIEASINNDGRWYPCFWCDGTGEVPFDPRSVDDLFEDIPEFEAVRRKW